MRKIMSILGVLGLIFCGLCLGASVSAFFRGQHAQELGYEHIHIAYLRFAAISLISALGFLLSGLRTLRRSTGL
jgi:hypothetical protein